MCAWDCAKNRSRCFFVVDKGADWNGAVDQKGIRVVQEELFVQGPMCQPEHLSSSPAFRETGL